MKKYTINGNFICYGNEREYVLGKGQNAETIIESVENVHRFLLENADISMLGDNSIFCLRIFSCSSKDLPYIIDMLKDLNHDLQEEPDEEPYFLFKDYEKTSQFFGDVLAKINNRTHYYEYYDMGVMDLQTLHNLLVFE